MGELGWWLFLTKRKTNTGGRVWRVACGQKGKEQEKESRGRENKFQAAFYLRLVALIKQ